MQTNNLASTPLQVRASLGVNLGGTCVVIDTKLAQRRSGPVRFESVSYRGEIFGPYDSMEAAAQAAKEKWPDQHQDEDRTGAGWDVQVEGAK
jgi:hypothetical protein